MGWNDTRTPESGSQQPQTDTEVAIIAGVALSAVDANPEKQCFVIVPRGMEVRDIEEFRERPRRIKTTAQLADVVSFLTYLEKFKTPTTVILTNARATLARTRPSRGQGESLPEVHITAHLDYHAADSPAWDGHKAQLDLIRTREWVAWTGVNKRHMNQAQLCEFIEENMPDIVEPASADLLEMLRTFEVKKDVRFLSGKNLQTGDTQFIFEETSTGTSAKGTIKVPEQIVLGVRIFEGIEAYRIPAKLRWKLTDAKLEIWFDLLRWQTYERDALDRVLTDLAQATDVPILQVSGGD